MPPREVERIAVPRPARMLGTLSLDTYTRRPGRDTRTSPEMIFSPPAPYFRYTRSVPCLPSSMKRKFLTNPSSFRTSVILTLSLEAGMSHFSCSARLALRIRVRRSAIGSVIMARPPPSPAGLDHARDFALQRELPEADPAGLEFA